MFTTSGSAPVSRAGEMFNDGEIDIGQILGWQALHVLYVVYTLVCYYPLFSIDYLHTVNLLLLALTMSC